jgi:hypothetical protein
MNIGAYSFHLIGGAGFEIAAERGRDGDLQSHVDLRVDHRQHRGGRPALPSIDTAVYMQDVHQFPN